MAQEEIKYTTPYDSALGSGSQVDLIVTYDPTMQNPNGSYTATAATGTYSLININGVVTKTDAITGIAPATTGLGGNDNQLYLVANPNANPIVTFNGISFKISVPADSNDTDPTSPTYGQVNFYDNNGTTPVTSPPTDTPTYLEDNQTAQNVQPGTVSQESAFVCFVSGTLIRTARGDVAVERLSTDDVAINAVGTACPIRWLGHRTVDCRNLLRQHDALPIRIAAHAFGAGLPEHDLFLSPGHPVLVGADEDGIGGYLVPIMCLINGTTIERVEVDEVTYWHVELDQHDILLAEGLPAESYIDLGSRPWFDGADGALFDPDMALPGMPGRCRPVAIDGPIVEAERRRLDAVFAARLLSAAQWPIQNERMLIF